MLSVFQLFVKICLVLISNPINFSEIEHFFHKLIAHLYFLLCEWPIYVIFSYFFDCFPFYYYIIGLKNIRDINPRSAVTIQVFSFSLWFIISPHGIFCRANTVTPEQNHHAVKSLKLSCFGF